MGLGGGLLIRVDACWWGCVNEGVYIGGCVNEGGCILVGGDVLIRVGVY